MYDVIVIGGGPIGSYVAYKLAGMGYDVLLLEQKECLDERICCTGIVSQECVSSFDIDDSVIVRQLNSVRLFSPSGRLLRLWRQKTQACIINRPAFDVAVASRAQKRGVEYLLSSPVRDIAVVGDWVRVEVAWQGQSSNFKARAVVIASGFGSRLGEGVGLGRIYDFVTGAQAEVETTGLDEGELYFGQEIAPGFFAWLMPTSPPKALVGLLSRHSPGVYLKKLMSSLLAQGRIVSDEIELSYRGVPLRPLARTYSDRLIVVGDAAGQVKPTTGGGIYYGLLCADVAADNLKLALENDDLSARSLASYERDWRSKLGRELKICYYARKFFECLSDRQIDRAFDIMESNGIVEASLRTNGLSFDWHGDVILKLLSYRVLTKVVETIKVPFRVGTS